ncbi:MAG: ferredoxin reductase [Polyangiaceae bacterium]
MGFAARKLWSQFTETAADMVGLAATPLVPAHYLELVHPLGSSRQLYGRVESIHFETLDTRTLTLRPGRGWKTHRAGQWVRIGVPVAGRITTRTYSISSAPERADGCIAITVKIVRGGRVSNALAHAKPGDHLLLALPEGEFTLPEEAPSQLLFVTAGSGVTPVMSMLRSFAKNGAMPDVVHVHYAPFTRDVIFSAELARLAAQLPHYRLVVVKTREPGARRFSAIELDRISPDWRSRATWACGPEALLETIEACFVEQNVARHLNVERFRPRLAAVDPSARGGTVHFGLSKKDVEASARLSILEAAEKGGVVAPHGCRMGICHSCDVTLKSGCVRDLRTGETISEPGARVQICVCAASGDVEVDL